MIASCAEVHLQTPYLYPVHRAPVPELFDSDGGGEQPLVGPAKHRIHLFGR